MNTGPWPPLAAAAALAFAAAPAASAGDVGSALFDGGPEAASVEALVGPGGGVPAPASRFACRTCHGRDGRGGREGGAVVPSIEPGALAAPTAGRPAYDADAFAAALRGGIDPGGRRLAPLMPRYKVSDAEAAELLAHLGAVAARERTGVTADTIRFGVPAAAGPDLVAAFRRAWLGRGDPRLHGRRLVVEPVDAAEAERVFALLFVPRTPEDAGAERARGGARDAPALFPLVALRGDENPELVRGLFASRSDQAAALLRDAPAGAALVADEDGRPLLEVAAAGANGAPPAISPLGVAPLPPGASAAVVMAGPDSWRRLAAHEQVAPGATLYGCLDDAASAVAELRRRGVRLVLADPRPARGAADRPPRPARERFAAAAAVVVEAALGAAGRDLTRGGLVRALAGLSVAPPDWPALDYKRVPLTGSRDVLLVRLEPDPR